MVRKKSVFYTLKSLQSVVYPTSTKRKHIRFFIARASNEDGTLLAAPCEVCQEAISQTSIQIIEYTTRTGSKVVERKTLQEEAFKDCELNKD